MDGPFCPRDQTPTVSASAVYGSSDDPLRGQVVEGRFEVVRFLAKGGFGAVYEVTDRARGERRAMKLLLRDGVPGGNDAERFRLEARTAMRVVHPNVVRVYHFGETEAGLLYYVMELLEGTPLDKVLASGAPLPLDLALSVAEEAALGLSAAHAIGLVHRDIKPGNIVLPARSGEKGTKILDFGIAKYVLDCSERMDLTATGNVLGSPHYMSPEQASGRKVDHRSDIYSLASCCTRR